MIEDQEIKFENEELTRLARQRAEIWSHIESSTRELNRIEEAIERRSFYFYVCPEGTLEPGRGCW